ncbi:MAG: D-aminoacylase [Blastocatellia bacterium]|jgi:N-acyl-D-amino-acid deacylase|nr:D-aminoacylase [Blastocatellia bacterium]
MKLRAHHFASLAVALALLAPLDGLGRLPAQESFDFDVLISGGTVYDGSGKPPVRADVGLRGDRIAAIGNLAGKRARTTVDASGLAVSPGFINMLSWSTESLLVDGRSIGELKQGVTTQIMGEGWSMGPVNDRIRTFMLSQQSDVKYDIPWTTLREYLELLERRGVTQNVASFVGATTIRQHVIGFENRPPTPAELEAMKDLVRREMEAGALGIGSSLVYPPAFYAKTEELIELCKVAARYKGTYISHMRSEGTKLVEGVEELIRISREAKIPAEIYHLKAAGADNWPKMAAVIRIVEQARRDGLRVRADMYTYTAGATSLDASLPPWASEGGPEALRKRLADPEIRARIAAEVRSPGRDWENFYAMAGSPDRIVLVGFATEKLKPLTGKSLAEIATMRGKDPVDTLINLLLEDQSGIGTVYFLMSEENVRRQIQLPWVSFGSDAASMATEGDFLKSSTHPRAYGNFARLLGRYVRDEKLIPLEEAIRRLTSLPATNLGLEARGMLKRGMFADLVVFDPATIADTATFSNPHQYAVGVRHVFVNGRQVLRDGEVTSARPGRALKGRGAKL